MFARNKVTAVVQRWLVFVVFVLVWQWAATVVDQTVFPTPLAILGQVRTLWFNGPPGHLYLGSRVGDDILPSIGRLATGWAIASVAGRSPTRRRTSRGRGRDAPAHSASRPACRSGGTPAGR